MPGVVSEVAGGWVAVVHLPLSGAAGERHARVRHQRHRRQPTTIGWNDAGAIGTLTLVEALSLATSQPRPRGAVDRRLEDPVWELAYTVHTDKQVTGSGTASAAVKTLWKDNKLYVLMHVTDPVLDVSASAPWEQDSVEIYVDNVNAKNGAYRADDTQIRINYQNVTSFGTGDETAQLARLTSATQVVDGRLRRRSGDQPPGGRWPRLVHRRRLPGQRRFGRQAHRDPQLGRSHQRRLPEHLALGRRLAGSDGTRSGNTVGAARPDRGRAQRVGNGQLERSAFHGRQRNHRLRGHGRERARLQHDRRPDLHRRRTDQRRHLLPAGQGDQRRGRGPGFRDVVVVPRLGSTYVPLIPTQILDTSVPIGSGGGHPSPRRPSGRDALTFDVASQSIGDPLRNVPANATAVTGILSVSHGPVAGFLGLTPNQLATHDIHPQLPANDTRSTGVTVTLGPVAPSSVTYAGTSIGAVDVAFDVTGYFIERHERRHLRHRDPPILDPGRRGPGPAGPSPAPDARTSASRSRDRAGIPVASDIVAVTGTLTVTDQTSSGKLVLGPDPADAPATATIYAPKWLRVGSDARATGVTVKLGTGGTLCAVWVGDRGRSTADVIFDVNGYFANNSTGAMYVPVAPNRILDTRVGLGTTPPVGHEVQELPGRQSQPDQSDDQHPRQRNRGDGNPHRHQAAGAGLSRPHACPTGQANDIHPQLPVGQPRHGRDRGAGFGPALAHLRRLRLQVHPGRLRRERLLRERDDERSGTRPPGRPAVAGPVAL